MIIKPYKAPWIFCNFSRQISLSCSSWRSAPLTCSRVGEGPRTRHVSNIYVWFLNQLFWISSTFQSHCVFENMFQFRILRAFQRCNQIFMTHRGTRDHVFDCSGARRKIHRLTQNFMGCLKMLKNFAGSKPFAKSKTQASQLGKHDSAKKCKLAPR